MCENEFWEQIEKDRLVVKSFLQAAEELSAQGFIDAAEELWIDAVNLNPVILLHHLGYKDKGLKLRTLYSIGLGPLFPLTEKEKEWWNQPMEFPFDRTIESLVDGMYRTMSRDAGELEE